MKQQPIYSIRFPPFLSPIDAGALSPHVPMLIPGIEYSLGEKNSSSNMKIDTLSFLHTLLVHTAPPSVFHPHIPTLVPPVETAVDDPFYKITSEALLVTQQLVKVGRFRGPRFSPPLFFCGDSKISIF